MDTEVALTSPTDSAGTHREAGADGDGVACATGKGGENRWLMA
jgi:hypothetical protein